MRSRLQHIQCFYAHEGSKAQSLVEARALTRQGLLRDLNLVSGASSCISRAPSAHPPLLSFPGVPPCFNEFLPKDSDEYKRWKASQGASTVQEGVANLSVGDGAPLAAPPAPEAEEKKVLPGGKVKKKQVPEVVLERNTRNKKKCVTTISGLETFGVKLAEASKLFGKKFASGASIVKNAESKEQIDVQVRRGRRTRVRDATSPVPRLPLFDILAFQLPRFLPQGDFLDQAVDVILKQFKQVERGSIYFIDNKKKEKYFTDDA